MELGGSVGAGEVRLLFGDVIRGETVVIGHTEGGGGTCVEQEAGYRVPSTVVSREDEGEKEEVGEERENVETGVGVGSRCR